MPAKIATLEPIVAPVRKPFNMNIKKLSKFLTMVPPFTNTRPSAFESWVIPLEPPRNTVSIAEIEGCIRVQRAQSLAISTV